MFSLTEPSSDLLGLEANVENYVFMLLCTNQKRVTSINVSRLVHRVHIEYAE